LNERQRARLFDERLEQLLQGQAPDALNGQDAGLLAAAGRLRRLPDLLPAANATFEDEVWARMRAVKPARSGWLRWPVLQPVNLAWLAPLAALLLIVLLILPGPRQAFATWAASFRLGRVQVAVTPEDTSRAPLTAQGQVFASFAGAEAAAGFDLLEPAWLPAGYELTQVENVSYEGLPAWLRPLYVEASYRPAAVDPLVSYYAMLREFNAAQQGDIQVGQIEFPPETVRTARDVTLASGLPAVLVEFEGVAEETPALRQIIWEQDGLTLELWSQVLSEAEMLQIVASVE